MPLPETKTNLHSKVSNLLLALGTLSGIGISVIIGFFVVVIIMFSSDNPNTPWYAVQLRVFLSIIVWIILTGFFVGVCGIFPRKIRTKHPWISYFLTFISLGSFFTML